MVTCTGTSQGDKKNGVAQLFSPTPQCALIPFETVCLGAVISWLLACFCIIYLYTELNNYLFLLVAKWGNKEDTGQQYCDSKILKWKMIICSIKLDEYF